MGKLVVTEFITLDGVVEDPGGSEKTANGGWAFRFDRGPEGDRVKLEELRAADAMLLGRVTYEGFAAAWPSVKDDVGFADMMNGMPKYVVSTTLDHADWNNSTVIGGDVVAAVNDLKQRSSGDLLVHGSVKLVQTLLANDLVDVLRLMVYPVVVGGGRRLFADTGATTNLRLVDMIRAADCAVLTYQR
jgi:dihydrofolate reductase